MSRTCYYIHSERDVRVAQALCHFVMASDPSPVDSNIGDVIIDHLDTLAAEYGFVSWIELFHADLTRPDPLDHAAVDRLKCHLLAEFSIVGDGYEDDAVACELHAGALAAPVDGVRQPATSWTLARIAGVA